MNTGHRWSPDEDAAITALQQEGLSDARIAKNLGGRFPLLTYQALRVRAGSLRNGTTAIPSPEGDGYITRWIEHLKIAGDSMIAGDFQVPFFHREAVEKLLLVARKLDIKTLTIGGDFFDVPYWSSFDQTAYLSKFTWDDDKRIGRELLGALAEWFDHIYIVADNHFRRALRKLDFKSSLRGLYGDVVGEALQEKIIASDYPIAELNNSWLVIHPAAYRQLKLSLASDLAMKFQRNVFNFHGHLAAKGISKYGNFAIVDGACMTDASLHEYIMEHPTPHPTWNVGFYALKDNWPFEFWLHKDFPWRWWLDENG